jgi:SOUL heme-binding protein
VTEQQEYRVVAHHGEVELREYADCVVADVVVSGSAEQAGTTAFRPLVSYISGSNRSR